MAKGRTLIIQLVPMQVLSVKRVINGVDLWWCVTHKVARAWEQERHLPKNLERETSLEHYIYSIMHLYSKKHAKCQSSCRIYQNMHICATCRWILHYYEVRNAIHGMLMIIFKLWKKALWINKQEHLNDKHNWQAMFHHHLYWDPHH